MSSQGVTPFNQLIDASMNNDLPSLKKILASFGPITSEVLKNRELRVALEDSLTGAVNHGHREIVQEILKIEALNLETIMGELIAKTAVDIQPDSIQILILLLQHTFDQNMSIALFKSAEKLSALMHSIIEAGLIDQLELLLTHPDVTATLSSSELSYSLGLFAITKNQGKMLIKLYDLVINASTVDDTQKQIAYQNCVENALEQAKYEIFTELFTSPTSAPSLFADPDYILDLLSRSLKASNQVILECLIKEPSVLKILSQPKNAFLCEQLFSWGLSHSVLMIKKLDQIIHYEQNFHTAAKPSKNRLSISTKEWEAADAYFKKDPLADKMRKKDLPDYDKLADSQKLKCHSFLKVNDVIYAMSNGHYEGVGSYGKGKIVQTWEGDNFFQKIEPRAPRETYDIDKNEHEPLEIMHTLGYVVGFAHRLLAEPKKVVLAGQRERITRQKLYTISQLYPGQELRDLLNYHIVNPVLTDKQKLLIALKCAQAIQVWHDHDFIHRDLKPENFKVTINGDNIQAFIVDYDFGRKVKGDEPIEQQQAVRGTRFYMAPEITSKAIYSKKSDLYALGIMLKEDLNLPPALWQDLVNADPDARGSIKDMIEKLQNQIKTTSKPMQPPQPILNIKSSFVSDETTSAVQAAPPPTHPRPSTPKK